MAMRHDILKAIEAGQATHDSLIALTGTTTKGLASQFTYLRMTGHYPVKDENGVYSLISEAEWEARKTQGSGQKEPTDPVKRYEQAQKRLSRTEVAFSNAQQRKADNPDIPLMGWLAQKAEAEFHIAEIKFDEAKTAFDAHTTSPGFLNILDEEESSAPVEEVEEAEDNIDGIEDDVPEEDLEENPEEDAIDDLFGDLS